LAFDFAPELRRCPWSQLRDPRVWEALQWWTDYKSYQLLPYEGGMRSQPCFVYDVMQLCSEVVAEIENRRTKQQKAELEKMTAKTKGKRHGR
jgi:hypothetical protein